MKDIALVIAENSDLSEICEITNLVYRNEVNSLAVLLEVLVEVSTVVTGCSDLVYFSVFSPNTVPA